VSRLFLLAVGFVSALLIVATATATQRSTAIIEPNDHVHGMLVVQGTGAHAQIALFGTLCRPDIVKSGRYRRTCLDVPGGVSRLFVGFGLTAPAAGIEQAWRAARWRWWVDGERVSLDAFGTSDRPLGRYPPAGGKDVILREWDVILMHPTPGRHTIRYRLEFPTGTIDATWEFRVTES
jgi:hypothetical protein